MKLLRLTFAFLAAVMLVAAIPFTVLAQSTTPTPAPAGPPVVKLDMTATFPSIEVLSGSSVTFEVNLQYTNMNENAKPKLFDIVVTAPKDWTTYVTPDYPADKRIISLMLDPSLSSTGQRVEVNVAPSSYESPEPGQYKVTLQLSSGDIKQSIDLTVVVTAKYSITLTPGGALYNMKATSGKSNIFSITVTNDGSSPVSSINLSSDKPPDWAIDFPVQEQRISMLNAGASQTLDLNIKPPGNAIAGDYQVTLRAFGKEASASDLLIRVTVETPTLWGWVGVGIIVIVIAAVAFVFMRFSRR